MNAQTAAVYDFQAPRPFRAKAVKGSRTEVSIHFKSRVSREATYKLNAELSHYLRMFEGFVKRADESFDKDSITYRHCADCYQQRAAGFIEALLLLGSIDLSQRSRLLALFAEQADLFEGRQVT